MMILYRLSRHKDDLFTLLYCVFCVFIFCFLPILPLYRAIYGLFCRLIVLFSCDMSFNIDITFRSRFTINYYV
jgi:hypothetical protein